MTEAPTKLRFRDRFTTAGRARREAFHTQQVSYRYPVFDGDVDAYFRALQRARGVTLRRVVEVRPGDTWQNGDRQETLAEGTSLIAFRGPRRRVNAFRREAMKEQLGAFAYAENMFY